MRSFIFASMFFLATPLLALDTFYLQNFSQNVEVAKFCFTSQIPCYMVERTTGNCFAVAASVSAGLTSVSCESLKKLPAIKAYLEKGTKPE